MGRAVNLSELGKAFADAAANPPDLSTEKVSVPVPLTFSSARDSRGRARPQMRGQRTVKESGQTAAFMRALEPIKRDLARKAKEQLT